MAIVDFTQNGYRFTNRTATGDSGQSVGVLCVAYANGKPATAMPSSVTYNGTTYTVRRAYITAESGGTIGAFGNPSITDGSNIAMPSTVHDVSYAFQNARVLEGNITVQNDPATHVDTFKGATKPIYVVRSSYSATHKANWRTIATQYANVHYEADDNPRPTITFTVKRVGSNGSTQTSASGTWAYLQAKVTYYTSYLPVGWSINKALTTTMDGTTITPTWSGDSGDISAWVNLNDQNQHTFSVTCTATIIDANSHTRATKNSVTATQVLPKAYATIDVLAGGEGIAFGQFATQTGFWCSFDSHFDAEVYCKDNASVMRKLFDFIHPVGSVYETQEASFDPNATWGGTWSKVGDAVPYIVDEGDDGIWTYRKWSDGYAECWGVSSMRSITSWSTWGGISYGNPYNQYDTYPSGLFLDTPECQAQLQSATADAFLVKGASGNATNTNAYYPARGSGYNNAFSYCISYHAVGVWRRVSSYKYIWERTA